VSRWNILSLSVLVCLDSLVPSCFDCTDHHQHLCSLSLGLPCCPNQSGNCWCGTHFPLLWAFRILDAIVSLYIRLNVCCAISFAVIWITQIAIPVWPNFGVRTAVSCAILITVHCMPVESSDSGDMKYFVCCQGRSFSDKAGGKGDLSNILNAATAFCWKTDQDALMISSVSEMYPTAVMCLSGARLSFCVVCRFWLPSHISKQSWTLAWNLFFSVSLFIPKSFSVFIVSNAGSSPANMPLLAQASCLTTTVSQRVSPMVYDCLQLKTSRPRQKLASTLTPCGMMENICHATLETSAYCGCVSWWCRQQSVIYGIHNLLLISIGSEW